MFRSEIFSFLIFKFIKQNDIKYSQKTRIITYLIIRFVKKDNSLQIHYQ